MTAALWIDLLYSASLSARTPKSTRAPHTLLQLIHYLHLRCKNSFDDQLCYPIALCDLEINVCVVEQ